MTLQLSKKTVKPILKATRYNYSSYLFNQKAQRKEEEWGGKNIRIDTLPKLNNETLSNEAELKKYLDEIEPIIIANISGNRKNIYFVWNKILSTMDFLTNHNTKNFSITIPSLQEISTISFPIIDDTSQNEGSRIENIEDGFIKIYTDPNTNITRDIGYKKTIDGYDYVRRSLKKILNHYHPEENTNE